jgi:hypothetical protein
MFWTLNDGTWDPLEDESIFEHDEETSWEEHLESIGLERLSSIGVEEHSGGVMWGRSEDSDFPTQFMLELSLGGVTNMVLIEDFPEVFRIWSHVATIGISEHMQYMAWWFDQGEDALNRKLGINPAPTE